MISIRMKLFARYAEITGSEEVALDLTRQIALSKDVNGETLRTRRLGAGIYYWGVFATRGDERVRLFIKARKITIKKEHLGLKVPKQLTWE